MVRAVRRVHFVRCGAPFRMAENASDQRNPPCRHNRRRVTLLQRRRHCRAACGRLAARREDSRALGGDDRDSRGREVGVHGHVDLPRTNRRDYTIVVPFIDREHPGNRLAVFDPVGKGVGEYTKRHLVPLAETYPPGDGSLLAFEVDGHRVGALICQDDNYSDVAREYARVGAELLISPTFEGPLATGPHHMANATLREGSGEFNVAAPRCNSMNLCRRCPPALEQAGNPRALRAALGEVARIAAIPRRIPASADAYEPLRRIVDGSDVRQIAQQTGLTRAEVEAAKRNLMLDEHVLVDNATGALYRGRFEPYEEVARLWGRAARGEILGEADRAFLRRLVRHEHAEGAILSLSGRTLEQPFLRGELEASMRTFLQSRGWNQARIDAMLRVEPRPMTPHRYAHLVASLSGAPNP